MSKSDKGFSVMKKVSNTKFQFLLLSVAYCLFFSSCTQIEIFEKEHRHQKCEKCEGDDKHKPILGLVIIKGLTKNDDIYDGGKIVDPKNGKRYHCKITLDGKDKLIVRGYIGIPLFGRSQTWIRQK